MRLQMTIIKMIVIVHLQYFTRQDLVPIEQPRKGCQTEKGSTDSSLLWFVLVCAGGSGLVQLTQLKLTYVLFEFLRLELYIQLLFWGHSLLRNQILQSGGSVGSAVRKHLIRYWQQNSWIKMGYINIVPNDRRF